MNIYKTELQEVLVIEPNVFEDDRGFFYESFNHATFENLTDQTINFVQDNHSKSSKGVLRGLHYQIPPFAQDKLVRVTRGKIFDVAVDIRKSSPTFKQWVGVILSEENKKQLWIPKGFAHGFLTLSDFAEVQYKTSNYYSKECDRSILWNDKDISIKWPTEKKIVLSNKDMHASSVNSGDIFK